MRTNTRYYLSSGRTNGMFTLRVTYDEPTYRKTERGTVCSGSVERDYYVISLTRDPETAVAKARKYLTENNIQDPFNESLPGDLRNLSRSDDWTFFRGGKYEGKTVEYVAEHDLDYAVWVVENMGGKRYEKTIALLREIPAVQERLAEVTTARQAEVDERESRKAKAVELLAPLAQIMRDGKGGFRDSIAQTLANGDLPGGRGESITLDILAKQEGRRGSKAYDAEYDRVAEIFEMVEG